MPHKLKQMRLSSEWSKPVIGCLLASGQAFILFSFFCTRRPGGCVFPSVALSLSLVGLGVCFKADDKCYDQVGGQTDTAQMVSLFQILTQLLWCCSQGAGGQALGPRFGGDEASPRGSRLCIKRCTFPGIQWRPRIDRIGRGRGQGVLGWEEKRTAHWRFTQGSQVGCLSFSMISKVPEGGRSAVGLCPGQDRSLARLVARPEVWRWGKEWGGCGAITHPRDTQQYTLQPHSARPTLETEHRATTADAGNRSSGLPVCLTSCWIGPSTSK